jgi:hypothetical protein
MVEKQTRIENRSHFFFDITDLKIDLFFNHLRNKKQKPKSQGYVKYPDWSVTKLRDAKLGVFWLALLWIFLPSVTKPKMTLDKEKISVCAWFYSFLRINKTVPFSDFLNYCFTREHNFFYCS